MSRETELAWAAGFFDGEGNVNAQAHNGGLNIRAAIGQIDRRPLVRFQRAVKMGKVGGPYARIPPRKPVYTWYMSRGSALQELYDLLRPYLSPIKKRQFKEVLSTMLKYKRGEHKRRSAAVAARLRGEDGKWL